MPHDPRWRAILEPLELGPLQLRNRLVFGPHCPVFVDEVGAGNPTEAFAAYMAERAEGGAAAAIIGVSPVHPSGLHYPLSAPALYDDRCIPGLQAMAEAVHRHDSFLLVQLSHPGLHGDPRWQRDPVAGSPDLPLAPLAPSAIPAPASPGVVARELDVADIGELIASFGSAAERAIRAGLDGVELQAGVGFLIEQFLSPLTNRRTDEWGGTFLNRCRFLLQVVACVREAIGPDKALGLRLTLDQMLPGGFSLSETIEVVGLLEQQGLHDYLNPCLGSFYLPQLHVASLYRPEAFEKEMVKTLRSATKRPVLLSNRITSIHMAGELIADGYADGINMVRQLIADPETLRKAQREQEEEITPCISCNQWCIGNVYQGLRVACVVNPRAGRESTLPRTIAKSSQRRLLVIGAGPAGLALSANAAGAGHQVTLLERQYELGGALRLAAKLPGREAIGTLLAYLTERLRREEIELLTGVNASIEKVLELHDDRSFTDVVVATGALRESGGWNGMNGQEIEGASSSAVLPVEALIAGQLPRAGSRVLVSDELGDMVAPGVAELLAAGGCGVDLVSRWPMIGMQIAGWGFLPEVLPRLYSAGVTLEPNRVLELIDGGSVVILNPCDGSTEQRRYDHVVLVGAPRANDDLYWALREVDEMDAELHRIGDAASPRSIGEAILEADALVRRLAVGDMSTSRAA